MPKEFEAVVSRLTALDLCVADLCRASGIARSTWDRWVRGDTAPNWGTWGKVIDAVEAMEASAVEKANAA